MSYQTQTARRLKEALRPSPDSENPFRALRLQANLTLEQLGKKCYVGKHALIRLEQGTFNEPLPAVLDYWVKAHGKSELQLRDAYINFQDEMRKVLPLLFGPDLWIDRYSEHHPLKQLRTRGVTEPDRATFTQAEVSKFLCIPQATVNAWERNWKYQQSVPKTFSEALEENGYLLTQIAEFKKLHLEWREHRLGGTGDG